MPTSSLRDWSKPSRQRFRSQRWLSELLQRRPCQGEMLGADIAEADRGLRLLAGTVDVDDDAFTELGMLDVVADPQPDLLGVARLRREPLAGCQGGVDDTAPG